MPGVGSNVLRALKPRARIRIRIRISATVMATATATLPPPPPPSSIIGKTFPRLLDLRTACHVFTESQIGKFNLGHNNHSHPHIPRLIEMVVHLNTKISTPDRCRTEEVMSGKHTSSMHAHGLKAEALNRSTKTSKYLFYDG